MKKILDFLKPKELLEHISPILISQKSTSVTISLSKRFLLFELLKIITQKIEDDPYLNFISVIKNYKTLSTVLNGTLYELYRDRNKMYFKNFFIYDNLYDHVKTDLEWVYRSYPSLKNSLKLAITKRGIIIYDNYQKNKFNVLVLSVHSGTWMRKDIVEKQCISEEKRIMEEDIATHQLFGPIVLEKGGIWIDNKASRFACDINRPREKAIYKNNSEKWVKTLWKKELSGSQRKWLMDGYDEFYFTLARLIEAYRFNLVFDGHSMRDGKGRAEISFGTKYIPKFYMPIIDRMKERLNDFGYNNVQYNRPYYGGNILRFLKEQFSDVFISSMEINKRLYMSKDRKRALAKKVSILSKKIVSLFHFDKS